MGDRGSFGRGARIYVGGLSHDTKKEDLENEFEKFGKLNHVWVAFNPPGFAFIEFSNKTDAENACDSMNGTELLGGKLRVEMSRERERGGSFRGSGYRGRGGPRGGSGGGGGFGGGYWGRGRGGFRESGGRGFGGRRGSSFRGREYVRGGGGVSRDSYGGGGGGGGGGSGGNYGSSYGSGGGNYSGGRSNYSRSRGSSRFRSRSPVGAGGSRRY